MERNEKSRTVPAPIRGWNTRDAIAAMDPLAAIRLDNFFPDSSGCSLRRGHSEFTTLSTSIGPIETLKEHAGLTGTKKLLAAVKHAATPTYRIYSVTTAGVVTNETGALTVSNSRWSFVDFIDSGGNSWIIGVNGVDNALFYDGTALTQPGTFTGVAETDLIQAFNFQGRIYFLKKNSTEVWYAGAGASSGALTKFDFGPFLKRGGYIIRVDSWSQDTNNITQDNFLAISDQGEVLRYTGASPATPWQLTGRYYLDRPIGRRCTVAVDGDIWIITQSGVIAMSQIATSGTPISSIVKMNDNIQPTFNRAGRLYKNLFGWEGQIYRNGRYAIFNIPTASLSTSEQYVMNLFSGAWCRFTGMNMICMEIFDGNLVFGGSGGDIYLADNGRTDNGAGISGRIKQAFNPFGTPDTNKLFLRAKPIIEGTQDLAYNFEIDTDFADRTDLAEIVNMGTSTPWGSAWGSPWGGSSNHIFNDWYSVSGAGNFGALRLEGVFSEMELTYIASSVIFEEGEVY